MSDVLQTPASAPVIATCSRNHCDFCPHNPSPVSVASGENYNQLSDNYSRSEPAAARPPGDLYQTRADDR